MVGGNVSKQRIYFIFGAWAGLLGMPHPSPTRSLGRRGTRSSGHRTTIGKPRSMRWSADRTESDGLQRPHHCVTLELGAREGLVGFGFSTIRALSRYCDRITGTPFSQRLYCW